MNIAIENLPIIFLIIIGIGVAIIVVSVISLAGIHEHSQDYYVANAANEQDNEETKHMEELFSYFLEEEEKKNEQFRQMVIEQTHKKDHQDEKSRDVHKSLLKKQMIDQTNLAEIIRRYEQGEDAQTIAKSLKKGIGEVKLIISLYSMR